MVTIDLDKFIKEESYEEEYPDGSSERVIKVSDIKEFVSNNSSPETAVWIHDKYCWRCSNCNERPSYFINGFEWEEIELPKYCPNCGKLMTNGGEEI